VDYEVERRQPRFLISVPASLARPEPSGMPAVHGLSLDLSLSGASAVLCGPPAVGERVRLSLQFSGASLEILAIVRHSHSTRSGFEFVDLSQAHREQLENRIRALDERPWPWRSALTRRMFLP
jgi:hypothetical protein